MLKLEVFSTVTSDSDKSNVATEENSVSDDDVCIEDRKKYVFAFNEKLSV